MTTRLQPRSAVPDVLDLFRKKGALLEGHFVLSSGLHSDRYLQTALVLQDPRAAGKLGKDLARRFSGKVDAVLSPAIGGLIIGHEVARAKGCRAIFSEKADDGRPLLRRGFHIEKGEKVLVIEDVITTGLSTSEVVGLVLAAEARLMGVGSVVNRAASAPEKLLRYGSPVRSLLDLDVKSWTQPECPLCKDGLPAVKPGSRKNIP